MKCLKRTISVLVPVCATALLLLTCFAGCSKKEEAPGNPLLLDGAEKISGDDLPVEVKAVIDAFRVSLNKGDYLGALHWFNPQMRTAVVAAGAEEDFFSPVSPDFENGEKLAVEIIGATRGDSEYNIFLKLLFEGDGSDTDELIWVWKLAKQPEGWFVEHFSEPIEPEEVDNKEDLLPPEPQSA